MAYSLSDTKNKIEKALEKLIRNDSFLIDNNTNERTITHKLAEYLQQEFQGWDVDCEYNRHGGEIKRIDVPQDNINWDDTEAKTVFPDIVIHNRNTDDKNLVIVEVKKSTNTQNQTLDKNKLIAFTQPPYNYKYGLFLIINVEENPLTHFQFHWFENGQEVENAG